MNKCLFLLLLLSSCAQLKKDSTLSDTSGELPAWIYAPYEGCAESQELCATGEAKNYTQADAQAKINLASIFEVKITSDLAVNSSSSQAQPWQNQVRQEVQQSLKESVNEVLEGVQIKKHYKKDGLAYSLASLDRAQAGELIGGRMAKIDEELAVLWKRRSRTNLRKILRRTMERDKLGERYSIVTGVKKPEIVSYAEVLAWKDSRPELLPLTLKVGQAPDWMVEKVREFLSEAGFRFVKGDSARVLTMNVDSIKEFLNVNGFEKYTFTLKLSSIEGGAKKKEIAVSETVTGRTQADALLKVKAFFSDWLEQHLSDLHLD